MAIKEFQHFKLNEEINSISGHMVLQKEEVMEYSDKELLFYTGYGVTDSSCCGNGGTIFTYITGFVMKWHYKTTSDGTPVSEVDTIKDDATMKDITRKIQSENVMMQVNFL